MLPKQATTPNEAPGPKIPPPSDTSPLIPLPDNAPGPSIPPANIAPSPKIQPHPQRFQPGTLAVGLLAGTALGVGAMLFYQSVHRDVPVAQTPGQHSDAAPTAGAKKTVPGGRKIGYYRAPMNPKQTSITPRKDAMGMDYLPVYEDEATVEQPVSGFATVHIDPDRQQLIGLTTAKATQGAVGSSIRTVGQVAVDETQVRRINVKVGGFVEAIYADFVGKAVTKGQALFTIYSPELVSAQTEYMLALDTRKRLAAGGAAAAASANELVAASQERLRLWDIPDSEIAKLAQTRRPRQVMTLFSPVRGVVTQKSVVPGMRLNPGDMPYEITDLSTVWVLADAYESDLAYVKIGMPASFASKASGRTYSGKVTFIAPVLDGKSRTVKVRLSFANADGQLRPETFGEVVLRTPERQAVRIPADAIVDSGTAQIVFVSLGDGKFQPRQVTTGPANNAFVAITKGVKAGEVVVTRANFLIDSESRLKASLAGMGKH
jgi:Cu(I)/Ag(I) efflux system membrane fusion protein